MCFNVATIAYIIVLCCYCCCCCYRYCDHCLKKFYKESPAAIHEKATWICPSCIGICCCAACLRRKTRFEGIYIRCNSSYSNSSSDHGGFRMQLSAAATAPSSSDHSSSSKDHDSDSNDQAAMQNKIQQQQSGNSSNGSSSNCTISITSSSNSNFDDSQPEGVCKLLQLASYCDYSNRDRDSSSRSTISITSSSDSNFSETQPKGVSKLSYTASAPAVQNWLCHHGFDTALRSQFTHFDGMDIFALTNEQLISMLDGDTSQAHRLYNRLRLYAEQR